MQSPSHILAQEGILTTFSIAKKVPLKDIKRLRTQFKKTTKSQDELNNMLKQALINETKKSIEEHSIPGLLIDKSKEEEKKRLMELTYMASIVAKKLSENGKDKYHLCFVVNALVNLLGLKEEDFDEFHRKFSEFQGGDSETE